MRRIKIPAKLGACRFCVRTALVGLAVAVGGYLLAALLLDSIVLVVVALVGVAGFGALCIAHGAAFVLRRLGWAYSVAPCCGELMERAERFQDLQSRRALLAKAVAVTGSVLLLDLATGAIGGRRAARAHHDDDGETEILTGDEADARSCAARTPTRRASRSWLAWATRRRWHSRRRWSPGPATPTAGYRPRSTCRSSPRVGSTGRPPWSGSVTRKGAC